MKKISIKTLAEIIKAKPNNNNGAVTGVSIDSRTTKPGDCFFAITGDNFDGHNFINDAFEKGSVCAVVNKDFHDETFADNTLLKVDDCLKALGDLARHYRKQNDFKVIAITGSVGKTTTRQIIYHVLSRHFRCRQAPKNFNNNIGLPLTLLAAEPNDEILIAELGSNHPGEIAYLTQIAAPDIAIVTNVHPVHLAGLDNLKTIAQEKILISHGLQSDGVFLINADCDLLVDICRAEKIQFKSFGKSNSPDIKVSNINCSAFQSRFIIEDKEIILPLPGPGNVENAAAAWAVSSQLGINIADFADAVKSLKPVPMRTELLQIGNVTVLNDCYNANPASMKNALDILTNLGSTENRRLVFICGDMAELGKQTELLHHQLGLAIVQTNIQLLLTIGNFTKITAETAKSNAGLLVKSFEDSLSACNKLKDYVKDSDIILVKGSRSIKLESVVEKLKELFS